MVNEKRYIEDLYLTRGLSSRQIADIFGVSHPTILKRMRRFEIPRRPHARKIENTNFRRMTKEKAYILGVMCGDGCLWKGFSKKKQVTKISPNPEYHIRLVSIDKDFVDYFSECMKKIYGMQLSYKFRESKNIKSSDTHTVYCRRKEIFNDVASYGNFSTSAWNVPKKILNSDKKKIIGSFLRGFFDSEGTVSDRKYHLYVMAFSTNLNGSKQIIGLLKRLEIRPTKISFYRNYYYFGISNKDGLVKFRKYVGFSIGRKLKRLESAIGQYSR